MSVFSHALAKRAGIATALTLDKRLEYQDAPLGHYHGQVPPELSLYHNIIQGGGVRSTHPLCSAPTPRSRAQLQRLRPAPDAAINRLQCLFAVS